MAALSTTLASYKFVLARVALGLLASFGLNRVMTNLLCGVKTTDTLTFAFASVLLCLVALVANFASARRAAGIDPASALREE